MAVLATLRDRAKDFLDIPTAISTYDSDIEAYVGYALNELWPLAQAEIDPAVLAVTDRDVALTAGTLGVRTLEVYDNNAQGYRPMSDYKVHNGKVWLDEPFVGNIRVFGLGAYTLSTLPVELELVLIYLSVSMFYTSLAGNKRKYNIYVGSAGASADRDMKDSANYYRDLAYEILNDRVSLRGA